MQGAQSQGEPPWNPAVRLAIALLIVVLVRCHRYVELFGMCEPECQMSVHERNEQEDVIDQVPCPLVPLTAPDVF